MIDLELIAKIRVRDKELYRPGGRCLQQREDIHVLLQHLDEVLAQRANGAGAVGE
jgi:hypothetical protein